MLSQELQEYCLSVAKKAKKAAAQMATVTGSQKNGWLQKCAVLLSEKSPELIAANELDVAAASDYGLTNAAIDRLRLTPKRLSEMASALEEIALFPDPVGQIIESNIRPNGIEVQKIRVPLGVAFFIYESRPNVTSDAAAICVKSGNAVILRGGKEAKHSNEAIVKILSEATAEFCLPADIVQFVTTTNRNAISHFLQMPELIDVAIPRGGEGLIRRVTSEAKMPVIKHFAGNCHVYIDREADSEIAERVLINSKCQRMGVCNAAESLVIHRDVAKSLLPILCESLTKRGIEIRGDETTCKIVPQTKQANEEDYYMEYIGPVISVKVVDSLNDAIEHINKYSSSHTEAIITKDITSAREFAARIDSSAVIINASTRFNDGGQFGLGAEIGISTDKFHARGPCGVNELTSYKYVVYGNGQIRE
ncbi:MAG: glutamate-5-semialdehyde dehydrogenase [Planctomycetaceae bacterium]|jgi:glutamate-5-semialdehyde dehydrogenase|nr:glutamate-5-semialdehyde dehydrogenase [Planctomycetaceae bacterium]